MKTAGRERFAAWICLALTAFAFLWAAPGWTSAYLLLVAPLFAIASVQLFALVTLLLMSALCGAVALEAWGDTAFLVASWAAPGAVLASEWLRDGDIALRSKEPAPAHAVVRHGYAFGTVGAAAAIALRDNPLWLSIPWFLFALTMWFALQSPREPGIASRLAAMGRTSGWMVLGAGLLWLIAEAGARAFVPPSRPLMQIYQLHPEFYKTHRPNSRAEFPVQVRHNQAKLIPIAISSQGLRDREFGPKAPGEVRIAVLGDSLVVGRSTLAEESMPRQLEAVLSERLDGRRVTVINAGLGGTGPWEQRGLLRDRVLPLEPDIVLHGLFPTSDIADSLLRVESGLDPYADWYESRLLYFINRDSGPVRLHYWLCGWSRAYLAACERILPMNGVIPLSGYLRGVRPLRPVPEFPATERVLTLETSLADWYPRIEQGFSLMQEDILAVRADCLAVGVDYAAFGVPHVMDLSDDYFQGMRMNSDPEAEYDQGKPVRLTQEFLDAAGIASIGIPEVLAAHPDPLALYYPLDGHLTAAGCRVVAESLADVLLNEYAHLFEPANGG